MKITCFYFPPGWKILTFLLEISEDADVTCQHLSCEQLQKSRKKVS